MKKDKRQSEVAVRMRDFVAVWKNIIRANAKKLGKPSKAQEKKIQKLAANYRKKGSFSGLLPGEEKVYYNLAKIAVMTPPPPPHRIKHKGHWYVLESSVRRSGGASQAQDMRGYFPSAAENAHFSEQQRAWQGAGPGGMT